PANDNGVLLALYRGYQSRTWIALTKQERLRWLESLPNSAPACYLSLRASALLQSAKRNPIDCSTARINDYQPYSLSLRYRVVLPIPSRRAALSLSSLTTFKALAIACFSRVARGTIFPAAPLRDAGAFFFDDLGIFGLVLGHSLGF